MTCSGWMRMALVAALSSAGCVAWAQSPPTTAFIYSCVDANGRKLTSDRPILECLDREQKIMGAGGVVRGRLTPPLTAQEQAEAEAKERRAAEVRAKLAEDKRKDRALLTRYPSKAVHEQERRDATAQLGRNIQIAQNRLVDLQTQRAVMDGELEFYKKDLSKAPAHLRSQVEENTQSQTMQRQFIAAQEAEVVRLNARFDEELLRLNQLWATLMPSASASTSSASSR